MFNQRKRFHHSSALSRAGATGLWAKYSISTCSFGVMDPSRNRRDRAASPDLLVAQFERPLTPEIHRALVELILLLGTRLNPLVQLNEINRLAFGRAYDGRTSRPYDFISKPALQKRRNGWLAVRIRNKPPKVL